MARPRSARNWDWIAVAAAATLIAALAAALLLTANDSDRARSQAGRWQTHTLLVISEARDLLSALQDTEIGQRGFLLTGDPAYLEPYASGARRCGPDLKRLAALTADNPKQQASIARLSVLIAQWRTEADRSIALARAGDRAGAVALFRQGQGKALTDEASARLNGVIAEERRLLAFRSARLQRASDVSRATLYGVIALGVLLAASAAAALLLALTLSARARLSAAELTAAERSAQERRQAAEELEKVNASLERRVAERTAAMEAAQAQILQMHKMESLGQLTGGIAHDFNNMLSVIIGCLDLAKRRLDTDLNRASALIDAAMEGAQRAAALTGRLLAFSRQQALSPKVIDANQLISGLLELMRRTLGDTTLVETALATDLWLIEVDPGELESAILNICVNARDAMEGGGRLTLETANTRFGAASASPSGLAAGDYVVVAVTDTGHGMAPDVVDRAFDPFYTTKEVGRGTGLGLSQVYGFVKQSGGEARIESALGQGTSLRLYLPRASRAATAPARSASGAPEATHDLGGETILAVEDDPAVRASTVERLKELGYAVLEAASAGEALNLIASRPDIALLFTDVVMPGTDGQNLAAHARSMRPGLKVLYTSGYAGRALAATGGSEGDFLAKPFTLAELAAKLRAVLES